MQIFHSIQHHAALPISACITLMLSPSNAASSEAELIFERCSFEANRYVVCRDVPTAVETALQEKQGIHAGEAFSQFIVDTLHRNNCTGSIDASAFLLNGVFFSFDSRSFPAITCNDAPLKLKFSPAGMEMSGFKFRFAED